MWIIPKTLSAFVPDTEGLNLALDERAWILEQSAMWRSKPSLKQTWLRRLKKGGWINRLSIEILKPSLHQSFEEKFVDSLEGIHANRSVAQGSDKEKKTQDTYGHTSSSTSGQLDLFGAFGKMSQDTPRWGYGESCPIWKKKVIDARGAYSQRKKLAHLINAKESSSWATPIENDSRGSDYSGRRDEVKALYLGGQVKKLQESEKDTSSSKKEENWPTARARDWKDTPGCAPSKIGDVSLPRKVYGLQDQENPSTNGKNQESWPTPRANKVHPQITVENREHLANRKKSNLEEDIAGHCGKATGKLNPNWVEQLMGITVGWTDLGYWETESFQQQQQEPLVHLSKESYEGA